MCTSIASTGEEFYFSRNMDLDYEFGEHIVITPRGFNLKLRRAGNLSRHYAVIGMAAVFDGYPMYAEAANERGLCMAGLRFANNAYYSPAAAANKINITPYELIPWLLGSCADLAEAKSLLQKTNIIAVPFSNTVPLAPLHWHIADKTGSIVVESTESGLHVYDNPAGVLTNNPGFDFQLQNLCQYMNLTVNRPSNCFSQKLKLKPFSAGLGEFGLPGDYSSASRFVKAAFLSLNTTLGEDEIGNVTQLFHLLAAVSMVKGCVIADSGKPAITTYSVCISADKGIVYYTSYQNSRISAVRLFSENIESRSLIEYQLDKTQSVLYNN